MKKNTMMIILAAIFAAIFLISAFVLWQDYKDQKESAEAFDDIASLVVMEPEPTEVPEETTNETVPENAPAETIPELTAFENYTETIPGTSASIRMVAVPGGTFTMGSPDSEPFHQADEAPQRQVEVSSFFMG